MKKFTIVSLCLLLAANLVIPLTVKADVDPLFNPNNIISDAQLLEASSMTLQEIQNFLISKNSYLAYYTAVNTHGDIKTAAEIIYDAAMNNYDCDGANLSDKPTEAEKKIKCLAITTVNPKFLLILLQKEQSLIEDQSPSNRQLDWAAGYGCPDGGSCNPYWQGFGKQVNSAALQFWWYLKHPELYKYKAGNTYSFSNPYSAYTGGDTIVTPANNATAALYNYTPHVFNGNYNVFNLWKRYFPGKTYPNGSLLQVQGEVGVWLIENGQKRPFLSKGALTSRFDESKIISIDPDDLNAYTEGAPIRFANYSLIKSPKGTIYLLVDEKKRAFSSDEAFKKIGYNPDEVVNASWQDVNSYLDGKPITVASAYPTGALLQDKITGGVYWVEEETKAPILDRSFLDTKFKGKKIIPVDPSELANFQTISPVLFPDGELLKSPASPAVYLIDNGQKRPFRSGEEFIELGYKWENIIITSPQILYLYPLGNMITIE